MRLYMVFSNLAAQVTVKPFCPVLCYVFDKFFITLPDVDRQMPVI